MTINEMRDCWYNETNNPDSMEWREDLTEYQRKLVEIWDEQFERGLARMLKPRRRPKWDCTRCVYCKEIAERVSFADQEPEYGLEYVCDCDLSRYYGDYLPHNGCKHFLEDK